MSATLTILAASSAVAIVHSVFLAAFLLQLQRGRIWANRILALILLAFAFRVSKSVIHFAFHDMSDYIPVLALAGKATLGPLLWLYWRMIAQTHQQSLLHNAWHFIPFGTLIVALPWLAAGGSGLDWAYRLVVLQMLIYIIVTAVDFARNRQNWQAEPLQIKWIRNLLIGFSLIWAVYFIQLFWRPMWLYAGTTTFAAMVLYWLSFWAMRQHNVLTSKPAKKPGIVNAEAAALYANVRQLFREEAIYKDSNLTVAKLAKQLHVQPYLLSRVINEQFGKSFPELLSSYRVQEARRQLSDPALEHHTVQTIAYNCGFNTLSSFYNAFKNELGMTPAQFRDQQQAQAS